MISGKENLMNMYHHKPTAYVPSTFLEQKGFGIFDPLEKGNPADGTPDGFGVRWVAPASAGGAPIPAPNEFVLTDITKWREQVTFPDVDSVDWEARAARETAPFDREKLVFDYSNGNGFFERLGALMGIEEALIAMMEEPEAVEEFFDALLEYKIKYAEKVAKYYKPDTFTLFDDFATARGLFISPNCYREMVKPYHTKFFSALKDMGIMPVLHLCGKADNVIEDIIETGAVAWSSIQPMNDIEGLIEHYGDRISFIGGYDTSGRPAYADQDVEIYNTEVRRCVNTYGRFNKAFAFSGYIMKPTLDPKEMLEGFMPMIREMGVIRQEQLAELSK